MGGRPVSAFSALWRSGGPIQTGKQRPGWPPDAARPSLWHPPACSPSQHHISITQAPHDHPSKPATHLCGAQQLLGDGHRPQGVHRPAAGVADHVHVSNGHAQRLLDVDAGCIIREGK